MTLKDQLARALELRATCERRTRERDDARARCSRLEEDADLGRVVRRLMDQITRLRRSPCPTMAFGIGPSDVANAVRAEVDEVEAEPVGSGRAQDESIQVVTSALHLSIVHGSTLRDGLYREMHRLRARLDHVDAGGTWAGAKECEVES